MRRNLKHRTTFSIGMILLAVANVGSWYLRRHTAVAENTVDLVSGLLFGLAIGTMILFVIRESRSNRPAC